MNRIPGRVVALWLVALGVACGDGGADRAAGVTATGDVAGLIFFDEDGSGVFDGADVPFAGARIRFVTTVARDTVVRVVAGPTGLFHVARVPVGVYEVVVDPASIGDSLEVVGSHVVALGPGDSVTVEAPVGYPHRAAIQVRSLPIGTRLFVSAVALHGRSEFSDTIFHMVDTSGAIRVTRIRPSAVPVSAGDSVRVRGRVAERDGQRVIDDATLVLLAQTIIPPIGTVTTGVAATADGGALDAHLVRIEDAAVVDTVTVLGNLTVRVNDGSGLLTVVLDRAADAAFRPPLAVGSLAAGVRYNISGILVPTGTGAWRLRPRSLFDLTVR